MRVLEVARAGFSAESGCLQRAPKAIGGGLATAGFRLDAGAGSCRKRAPVASGGLATLKGGWTKNLGESQIPRGRSPEDRVRIHPLCD